MRSVVEICVTLLACILWGASVTGIVVLLLLAVPGWVGFALAMAVAFSCIVGTVWALER